MRGAVDLVPMVAEFLLDMQRPETVDADAVEQFTAHEKGGDAESSKQPFARAARQGLCATRVVPRSA